MGAIKKRRLIFYRYSFICSINRCQFHGKMIVGQGMIYVFKLEVVKENEDVGM